VIMLKEGKSTGTAFSAEWDAMEEYETGAKRIDFATQSCNRHDGGSLQLVEDVPGITQEELEKACADNGVECTIKIEDLYHSNVPSVTLTDHLPHAWCSGMPPPCSKPLPFAKVFIRFFPHSVVLSRPLSWPRALPRRTHKLWMCAVYSCSRCLAARRGAWR
jgi:hypothetical protein